MKSKAKKSKATCVQSEGSQVKFEESQPAGKSPPVKSSSFKPPKRKFKSFMPSSDEEGTMHSFDSPANRKEREMLFESEGLTPPLKEELEAFWQKYMER